MDEKPLREIFGETLLELGSINQKIIALDADLSEATRSILFGRRFPERFFNFGIAEANMVSIAAGFSTCGLIPYVCSFSFLLALRAADQIRSQISYPNLNVKLVGTNGGLSGYGDGATHQCIKDIAIMRAMPNMTILVPSDEITMRWSVKAAAEIKGPVFIRVPRVAAHLIHKDDVEFSLGKGIVLRTGKDVTIVSTGLMVDKALQAAGILAEEGIDAEVLEMLTIKPFDQELIVESAAKTGAVISVEEHNRYGGLFSAVSETVVENYPVPVMHIAIEDRYGESGKYEEVLAACGLTVANIITKVKDILQRK